MNDDKTNRIDLGTCNIVESRFRPSKLDEKLIEDFRELLPNCFFLETACAFLGISRQSVYNWRKRGQREVERMAEEETSLCRPSELLYVKFFYVYVKAMATSEIRANSAIMQAGQVSWQAAAWQLERRYPERPLHASRGRLACTREKNVAQIVVVFPGVVRTKGQAELEYERRGTP